jgi:hypothetical protein
MNQDQKAVAAGAIAGVLFMVTSVFLIQQVLGAPIPASAAERLAYALKWDAVAALPFFLMLVWVGNGRFLGPAIDPTLGQESAVLVINGRVADNTTQQLLLFVVASLALSLVVQGNRLSVIAAGAITFVIVRIAFWIGYRIKPVHRAFGFAGTGSLNLAFLASALWLSFR